MDPEGQGRDVTLMFMTESRQGKSTVGSSSSSQMSSKSKLIVCIDRVAVTIGLMHDHRIIMSMPDIGLILGKC